MRPTQPGKLGDTHFDGETTWLCMGGNEWVDRLPDVKPPKQVWTPGGWIDNPDYLTLKTPIIGAGAGTAGTYGRSGSGTRF